MRGGTRPQLGQAPERDQTAPVEDADPIAQCLRHVEAVRGEEDRHAVCGELGEPAAERDDALRIDPDQRLVEDEDARAVHERRREGEALLHAVRVRLGELRGALGEAEPCEQLGAPALELAAAEAVEPADEAQELAPGELVVEEGMVRQVAGDRLGGLRLAADVVPAEQHAAGGRREEPHHHPDGRRLAGAVGSDEAEHPSLLDREVEAGDGDRRPVFLAQPDEANHGALSSAVTQAPSRSSVQAW